MDDYEELKKRLRETEEQLAAMTVTAKAIAQAADRMRAHEKRQDELLRDALRERDAAKAEVARLRLFEQAVQIFVDDPEDDQAFQVLIDLALTLADRDG